MPAPGKQVLVTEGMGTDVVDGYWLYLPRSFDKTKTWPVLVCLGGAGGELTPTRAWGPSTYAFRRNGAELDSLVKDTFIIVDPHLKAGPFWERQWYDQTELLGQLLDEVIRDYSGDAMRVYVTGTSRGGHGTWGFAERARDRIAAIAPVAGATHGVSDFSGFADLPVWIFHNTGDPTVAYSNSRNAVSKIEATSTARFHLLDSAAPDNDAFLTQKHIFTSFDRDGHDAWTETYSQPHLYRWLLQFQLAPTPGRSP